MKTQKERNIFLLSLINFFIDFRLYAPIAILYFKEITGSFMLGMAVFSITSLASTFFELPAGLISDRAGRRITLVYGAWAGTLSIFLYAIAPGIALLMAGAFFEGLSRAFYSGNNEALLYDTLKEAGEEKEYHQYSGKTRSFFQIALAVSALLGSLLADRSFRLVMGLTVFFQACVIPLGYLLKEPAAGEKEKESSLAMLKNALSLFKENHELRRVSFANLLTYAGGEAGFQFQSAFVRTLWPVWAIGAARTLSNGLAALSFWFSGCLIKKYGDMNLMIFSKAASRIISLVSLFFPTAASPLLISSTSVFYGVSSVSEDNFNQKQFSHRERATMGSVVSFVGALLFAVYSPLLGWAADIWGPGKALIGSQLLMVIPIFMLTKSKKRQEAIRG